jgi:hypothetical protein
VAKNKEKVFKALSRKWWRHGESGRAVCVQARSTQSVVKLLAARRSDAASSRPDGGRSRSLAGTGRGSEANQWHIAEKLIIDEYSEFCLKT